MQYLSLQKQLLGLPPIGDLLETLLSQMADFTLANIVTVSLQPKLYYKANKMLKKGAVLLYASQY